MTLAVTTILFSKMMMTQAMTIMNLITKMLSNEIELSAFALPTFQGEQWRAFRIKIIIIGVIITIIIMVVLMGCTQNPISTLSHIWDFVRLYGIVFVIIAIIIIIIIIIIKSEGVNAQL